MKRLFQTIACLQVPGLLLRYQLPAALLVLIGHRAGSGSGLFLSLFPGTQGYHISPPGPDKKSRRKEKNFRKARIQVPAQPGTLLDSGWPVFQRLAPAATTRTL